MKRLRKFARGLRESDNKFSRDLYKFVRATFRWVGRHAPWLGHLGWTTSVRTAVWEGEDLVISGWAYHRGTDFGPAPRVRVWLVSRGSRIELAAETVANPDILGSARLAEFDYSNNGFSARVTRAQLQALAARSYTLIVEMSGQNYRISGPVRPAYRYGSVVSTRMRKLSDGSWAGPLYTGSEFRVTKRSATKSADAIQVNDGEIELTIDGQQYPAVLANDTASIRERRHKRVLAVVNGKTEPVEFSGAVHLDGILFRADNSGYLEAIVVAAPVEVHSVEFVESDAQVVVIGKSLTGQQPQLGFESLHHQLDCDTSWTADGEFRATANLRKSIWEGPTLPVASGVYELVTKTDSEFDSTFLTEELGATFPQVSRSPELTLRFGTFDSDQLALIISRPRNFLEYGSFHQRKLRSKARSGTHRAVEAVYLESFFGRNATCNPYAMDRYLSEAHPEIPRYWGVSDYSVAVPDGAKPLIRGSEEWWRMRSSARWIVTNEWLGAAFEKRDFQTILQTWHGSMFKRIGFDRAGMGKGHRATLTREKNNWDFFVSQAAVTTPIIQGAYGLAAEQILEVGYPRNDELNIDRPDIEARVRRLLAIPESARVVMYAPTWRDATSEVELLDVHALANVLGKDYVVLNRSHVRTLATTEAIESEFVRDVSTYPQLNDLYRISDLLVTDYSSMMFDYSVLGRPMLFYTPDLSEYTDSKVRGSYFDLEEFAPGPVIEDYDSAVEGVRSLDSWIDQFSERYEKWRDAYNALDDGKAAQRAVQALLTHKAL